MTQRVDFFGWILDVDLLATQNAYEQLPADWDCACSYCRNFRAALPTIPEVFRNALQAIGVNLVHPAEAISHSNTVSGLHFYEVWYHAVGRIVVTPLPLLDRYGRHRVVSAIDVRVSDQLALLADSFPLPAMQIEFFVYLPWVLDEAYK